MTKTFEDRRSVPMDLGTIIDAAVEEARGLPECIGVMLMVEIPSSPVVVNVIPQLVESALVNVLVNAAEASPQGRVKTILYKVERNVFIEVHDDGPGVPRAMRQSVFLPHVTTKPVAPGMGLVAVDSTMHVLGGEVTIDDSDMGGACFRLRFPIA